MSNTYDILNYICQTCNEFSCLCLSKNNENSNDCLLTNLSMPNIPLNSQDSSIVDSTSTTPSRDSDILTTTNNSSLYQLKFAHKGLRIANLNIRHLVAKLDELRLLLCSNSIDIFGVCETFLDDTVGDELIRIDSYNTERKDRDFSVSSKSSGGGVCLYVANQIQYVRRHDLETNDVESIWLEIRLPNTKPFLLCSLYRAPWEKVDWVDKFEYQVETAISLKLDEMYILGDLNISFNNDNSQFSKNRRWSDFIYTYDFCQLINQPTRVTEHSSSIIDHIYVSNCNRHLVKECFVSDVSISDHYIVCFTRCSSRKYVNMSRPYHEIQYRSYKTFRSEEFVNDLALALANQNFTENPNTTFQTFINIFSFILNRHAPLKMKRVKNRYKPEWLNDDILKARFNRDKYHKMKNWVQFRYWRNRVKSLIRCSKRNFFTNAIASDKNDSYLWKHVNSLLKGKPDSSNTLTCLNVNGVEVTDTTQIANCFNTYFVNIKSHFNLVDSTDTSNNTNCEFQHELLTSFVSSKVSNDIFFHIPFVKESEVIQYLSKLNSRKATGIDGIGPYILKLSSSVIVPYVTSFINMCIHHCVFPDCLKQAKVFPIFKSGDKNNPSNYRPISVLPTISKIFERHLAKHLFSYLNKYKLIHEAQSGFRQYHSCQTALIKLIDNWLHHIDNGESIGVIFYDLRKAFDFVDHNLLVQKLKYYKFSENALKLFQSYLSQRHQVTVVGNSTSEQMRVTTGVPQGSVLGPILFLLYINDLPLSISNCNTDLFADDTTMHAHGKDSDVVESQIRGANCEFIKWCSQNHMLINVDKSSVMRIGTVQKLSNKPEMKIEIDNNILREVSSQKLLGLFVDKHLTWNVHIDSMILKISRKLSLMKLLSKYIPTQSLIQFYNAYILPLFDYGCITWGSTAVYNIDRLLKLQKRAARIILKADIRTPSAHMFDTLKWLPWNERIRYHTLLLTYKALNNFTPLYISDLLTPVNYGRNLRSVTNQKLTVPRCKTTMFQKSFTYKSTKLWNTLPLTVRHCNSIDSFKRLIKDFLFQISK